MQFILDFKLYFTSGPQVLNDNKHIDYTSPILGSYFISIERVLRLPFNVCITNWTYILACSLIGSPIYQYITKYL